MSWLTDLLRNFYPDLAKTTPPALSPELTQADSKLLGPFHYLIAVDDQIEGDGCVFEMGYHGQKPLRCKAFFRYGNLLAQENFGRYGPYLKSSDTAEEYGERVVDPTGGGWIRLLKDQCDEAIAIKADGIEWDNPDSYQQKAVLSAVDYAWTRSLKVIGKNPLICQWDAKPYISHPAICAVVVERGCGNPKDMDDLRKACGKPNLLIVFVAFRDGNKDGKVWIHQIALQAAQYSNMWCTYSANGEYTQSEDVA